MTPPDNLDRVVDHLLGRLVAATADVEAPWRTPMLATAAEDAAPSLRTVVLRAVEPENRVLRINTDRRSDKAAQIARHPPVALGFWDPVARQQLRVSGRAEITTTGTGVDAAWSALPPEGRAIYRSDQPPGAPQEHPGSPNSSVLDGDDGRAAFAVITVRWREWDWLWLGPQAHWRARVRWLDNGSRRAEWVVP